MKIKKFKNGNINFKLESNDFENGDIDINALYDNDMFFSDLYFEVVEDCLYMIDFNKSLVYHILDNYVVIVNILGYFEGLLLSAHESNNYLKLYPLNKRESHNIIMTYNHNR